MLIDNDRGGLETIDKAASGAQGLIAEINPDRSPNSSGGVNTGLNLVGPRADYDIDGNGVGGDIFHHREVYVALPGDANLDGRVDVLGDGFTLVGNLGSSGGWDEGDFNNDGQIDVLGDAFALIGNLGQSVIPAASQLSTLANNGRTTSRPCVLNEFH